LRWGTQELNASGGKPAAPLVSLTGQTMDVTNDSVSPKLSEDESMRIKETRKNGTESTRLVLSLKERSEEREVVKSRK
jgi:hypothetical protein